MCLTPIVIKNKKNKIKIDNNKKKEKINTKNFYFLYLDKLKKLKNSNDECESGGISYSLPCESIYFRSVNNEIKRVEIEIYNKELINIYDDPLNALIKFQEKNS